MDIEPAKNQKNVNQLDQHLPFGGGPDIRALKIALNRLGYYTPAPDKGMDDDKDKQLLDAIYAYQRKSTVFFDDTGIGEGSTTERLLNADLGAQEQSGGRYIWHAVGDDHVRHDHALREGRVFDWDQPPEGGHPGEDYNCRCWAEPLGLPHHPWKDWVKEREAKRRVEETLAPEKGLNDNLTDLITPVPTDAINPVYPVENIFGTLLGGFAAKTVAREALPIARAGLSAAAEYAPQHAKFRDTEWIRSAPRSQLQRKFKHAKNFGIKGSPNNKTIEAYKKALEEHVRSPETIVKKGTLHKKSVTHYYNPETRVNVIKNSDGKFVSGWKLDEVQHRYMMETGSIGGQ